MNTFKGFLTILASDRVEGSDDAKQHINDIRHVLLDATIIELPSRAPNAALHSWLHNPRFEGDVVKASQEADKLPFPRLPHPAIYLAYPEGWAISKDKEAPIIWAHALFSQRAYLVATDKDAPGGYGCACVYTPETGWKHTPSAAALPHLLWVYANLAHKFLPLSWDRLARQNFKRHFPNHPLPQGVTISHAQLLHAVEELPGEHRQLRVLSGPLPLSDTRRQALEVLGFTVHTPQAIDMKVFTQLSFQGIAPKENTWYAVKPA